MGTQIGDTNRPVTRKQIEAARDLLHSMEHRYLEEHGWKHTCQTPGSTWLWVKRHREDKYMTTREMALCLEEHLSAE